MPAFQFERPKGGVDHGQLVGGHATAACRVPAGSGVISSHGNDLIAGVDCAAQSVGRTIKGTGSGDIAAAFDDLDPAVQIVLTAENARRW